MYKKLDNKQMLNSIFKAYRFFYKPFEFKFINEYNNKVKCLNHLGLKEINNNISYSKKIHIYNLNLLYKNSFNMNLLKL